MISIVVPVYNAEKYIERLLSNIVNQTYKEYEVIFINDCSSDNTHNILTSASNKYKFVKIVEFENNQGPMCAREAAFKIASGEYLMFCDVDDGMPDNALELLYNEAKRTGADIVAGSAEYIKSNGDIEKWGCKLSYGNDRLAIFKSLLHLEYRHNIWAKLYKTELFTRFNYVSVERLKYFEDYWLFYQIVNNSNTFSQINNTVYFYYQNAGSSTQQQMNEWRIECNFIARKNVYDLLLPYKEISKDLNSYMQKVIIDLLYNERKMNKSVVKFVEKYDFSHLLSISALIKNNNLKDLGKMGIKYIMAMIKTKWGGGIKKIKKIIK